MNTRQTRKVKQHHRFLSLMVQNRRHWLFHD